MARYFIDRPILAWVIAIIVMLAGAFAITQMPVSMYPTIAPPTIAISATYPGASAKVVENSVTQIVEQNMKGLDGLLYMSATSAANGTASVTLTFDSGTDPDIAQVQVQNKLQLAMPLLPQEVQRQGVNVSKSVSGGFMQVLAFVSEDGNMSREDIGDYVASTLVDPLSRIPGVGNIQTFGSRYAMRIWLDPGKLETYQLTVTEVIASITAQNAQVAVGQLGGAPSVPGQQLNATISAQDRLQTAEQFSAIVIRSQNDGAALTLGEIARVEMAAETYEFSTNFNGKPATGVAIALATGANALDVAKGVEAELKLLAPYFPPGLKSVVAHDTTPFVRVSIEGVIKTLLEAILLVFLVMYLFLQNFRATLIPTIAVPVVLLGTFGVLYLFGFTVNMLTMFAMVLAIGLLVDDAIVVVENVERIMSEESLSPREAARKSMDQITGALVGIGLVLSAVFVPMAFMGGSTGVIYRQFSVTVVAAMVLSVLVAIVLTPALCATLLKPVAKGHHVPKKGFFGWFNRSFDNASGKYQRGVKGMLGRGKRFMAIFAALGAVMLFLFVRLPTAFLPAEDQGTMYAIVQTPVGATQERTMKAISAIERHFLETEKDVVASVFGIQGFSFGGSGQNAGLAFIKLKDWEERTEDETSVTAVAARAMGVFSQIKDATIIAVAPPAVSELGTATGFTFFLKDNAGLGHDALLAARNQLLAETGKSSVLAKVRPNGQEDTPQLRVDVDARKAGAMGLALADVNATLAAAWGGRYIDDFIDRGRVKRVYIQADAPFRMTPDDFLNWSVRNSDNKMVPFSAFATSRWQYGSPRLERFNGVPAMEVQGEGAAGVSSGNAMAEIERLAALLPPGIGIEWSGMSYQERQAGSQTMLLYGLSLLIVFLCLAGLYESWTVPTAVLLVAPLGILGAVLANTLMGMQRDVYFQVAMLTTVGLTSKNAILIVEFAKANVESGMELIDATMHAVRDRLRPIIMTSLAFGLGVLPLALASGAGSGAQRAIGTGVLGGMLVGTMLGIFFIPLFFVIVQRLFGGGRNKKAPADAGRPSATTSAEGSTDV